MFSWAQGVDEAGRDFTDSDHFYYAVFDQPNRTRHEWLYHFFVVGKALCHPSVLARRACYAPTGLYDARLAQFPDLDLWIRFSMHYEIHVLPERLVRYRVLDNGVQASGDRLETRLRSCLELQDLFARYLALGSLAKLRSVFPNLQVPHGATDEDPPFVLA